MTTRTGVTSRRGKEFTSVLYHTNGYNISSLRRVYVGHVIIFKDCPVRSFLKSEEFTRSPGRNERKHNPTNFVLVNPSVKNKHKKGLVQKNLSFLSLMSI